MFLKSEWVYKQVYLAELNLIMSSLIMFHLVNISTHFFFCKNKIYKNIEPQYLYFFKNIFIAEIGTITSITANVLIHFF